jgi:hypothetical protein
MLADRGPCHGDRGGGFYIESQLTGDTIPRQYLGGIVSRWIDDNQNGLSDEIVCDLTKNVIFTKVHAYHDWLRLILHGPTKDITKEILP